MDVDRRLGIVTVKETRAFCEMCIEAGFLLREVSLIQGHAYVWHNNWPDDLRQAFIALREGLEVWRNTGKTPELDPVLAIAHLLKLRVDAFLAEHGGEEGALGLEELS